jgi:CDP-diacylglycerol--glycerol-3-phosphate 3-phosphatidyltransferase
MKNVNIANIITALRIVGCALLFVWPPLSLPFLLVYAWCGISDVLDGALARRFALQSDFGSALDSIADALFVFCSLVRLYPLLKRRCPSWIWIVVAAILLIKGTSLIVLGRDHRQTPPPHTILDKLSGVILFPLPFLLPASWFFWYLIVACGIASVAAIDELLHVIRPR